MSHIIYNSVNSEEFGLKIENYPEIPAANEEFESIDILGGDSLTVSKGFSNIEIPFNFVYKASNDDFYNRKAKIDAWLNSKINQELEYSFDKTRYYKVKKVSIGSTKTTSRIVRRFTVTFTIEGLKYLKEGKEQLDIISSTTLYNERANYKEHFPRLKIYGTSGTVNINNLSFTVKNIDEYIIIDSKMKFAYKEKMNKGRDMTGDWPVFFSGENTISWSGNITKIEVTPNWRCY